MVRDEDSHHLPVSLSVTFSNDEKSTQQNIPRNKRSLPTSIRFSHHRHCPSPTVLLHTVPIPSALFIICISKPTSSAPSRHQIGLLLHSEV